MRPGEVVNLPPRDGYALVGCELVVFKPEA